jgi:hypothetical protein
MAKTVVEFVVEEMFAFAAAVEGGRIGGEWIRYWRDTASLKRAVRRR